MWIDFPYSVSEFAVTVSSMGLRPVAVPLPPEKSLADVTLFPSWRDSGTRGLLSLDSRSAKAEPPRLDSLEKGIRVLF